jgi:hypothetical protein
MKLAAVLMLGLLQAQTPTFSGTLADADCKADDATAVCRVLPTSKAFGVQTTDGKYLKLDSKGNAQVEIALRRLRRKTGDLNRTGVIKASISGARDGDTIKVDSVELY